ncbi:uncharacterized protein LOC107767346 [Nicotiana tabacum]|uniref:uncharacterized protein LOC107767346 n=1 Tax=Nicotiana tabacum TaxID=4097 RepID=UPI003F4EDEAF
MGDQLELNSQSVIETSSPQMTTIGASPTGSVVLDSSHPFYLHPSDSPGMLLVNTAFDGKGYGGWRRGMLIALSAKNKVGFIDGTFLQPKISSDVFKSWTRCNDMVISWLLNSLSKAIAESVLYSKTAKDIWDELEESCGAKIKNFKSQQDSRLIQFLMGLNGAYAVARSNLLMPSPLPSVNHAYSLLIRDEKQREVHISHHPAESVFVAAQQSYGGQKVTSAKKFNTETKKGTQFCNYCKKQNHTIENCYRLIGFPSDFKFTKFKRFSGAKSNAILSMETLRQAMQEIKP